MVYAALLSLHVALAALWFASVLGVGPTVRRALETGPEAFRAAADWALRRDKMAAAGVIGTFVTGLINIFYLGGFGEVAPTVHTSLLLVFAMIVVGFVAFRPAAAKLVALARSGDGAAMTEARQVVKRLSMLEGINHTVWLVVLVLMFSR